MLPLLCRPQDHRPESDVICLRDLHNQIIHVHDHNQRYVLQACEVQADAANAAAAAAHVRVWTSSSRDALHFHFCDKDKVRVCISIFKFSKVVSSKLHLDPYREILDMHVEREGSGGSVSWFPADKIISKVGNYMRK